MFNVINQRLLLVLWETLYYRDNLRLDLYHMDNYVVFLFSFGNFPKFFLVKFKVQFKKKNPTENGEV